jgi:hypothetical protein
MAAQKKLEPGSEYAQYDIDGDGVVTDEELSIMKEMHEVERADRKQFHQRMMAWYALVGMISYPATIICCELFGLSGASKLLTDIAPTYFIAAAGVAGAFMGFNAMANTKK